MSDQITPFQAIEQTQDRFMSIAPSWMKFDAEQGFAKQHLSNNSYLFGVAQKNPVSLMQAITNVAAIGLSLNPAEKLAYLIPRNVKIGDQYITKVFLEPSYMGLCKLATDTGSIQWIQANVVYANDEFIDNGPGEKPSHKYKAFAKQEERGEFVGVYCVAKTEHGDYLTTIMPAEEVLSIRERSEQWKKSKSGPWASDFNEQAKKTVVRRAHKMWPRTNQRLAEAVDLSNNNEGFEAILSEPSLGQYSAETKAYFDGLIEKADAIGMYTFQRTTDESTFNNLYHSFAKGTKGKYQGIIKELIGKGASLIQDCADAVRTGIESGDDAAVLEIVQDLQPDTLDLLLALLTPDQVSTINEIKEAVTE